MCVRYDRPDSNTVSGWLVCVPPQCMYAFFHSLFWGSLTLIPLALFSFAHFLYMQWMLNKYQNTYCVTFVRARFFRVVILFSIEILQSTFFTHQQRIKLKRLKAFAFRNVNVIRTSEKKLAELCGLVLCERRRCCRAHPMSVHKTLFECCCAECVVLQASPCFHI